ncbi:MAG: PleD family two-component system response regulator [Candidatus Methylomirabilia bacterium]
MGTDKHTPTAVVIQDSPLHRKILSSCLRQSLGCQVREAAEVEAAVSILLREQPDLIVTDLTMPELDGLDLVTILQVRDEWRHIPVVVHSGANDVKRVRAMMNLGITDYILKPFDRDIALPRLKKVVEALPPKEVSRPPKRPSHAPGQIPVLLVTARDEFGELVRREADALYDVIPVESGPAAVAVAIDIQPWAIFLTPELTPWDEERTRRTIHALKTVRSTVIALPNFQLHEIHGRLKPPPFAITSAANVTTVTLQKSFDSSCLDALKTALTQAMRSETEEVVFETPTLWGGQVPLSSLRELAHTLGEQASRELRDTYVSLSR